MADDRTIAEFLKLLTAHEVRLRAFALSLTPNWNDAQDVLQDAKLVIWQKFSAFETGTNFFSWAARIVHLTALDYRKRQRRSALRFSEELTDLVAQETIAAAEELSEREHALNECVKKLKPRQKQLIDMRYGQSLSGEQLAQAVGTTHDAVYQALVRIRKALFDCVNRRLGMEGRLAT